jgi:chromosomal replication initiation ATPase DnaA
MIKLSKLKQLDIDFESPSIQDVVSVVAMACSVRASDIASDDRHKVFTEPRHLAWLVCHRLNRWGLKAIAYHTGRANHTAVMYGIRVAETKPHTVKMAEKILALFPNPTDPTEVMKSASGNRQRLKRLYKGRKPAKHRSR